MYFFCSYDYILLIGCAPTHCDFAPRLPNALIKRNRSFV